MDTLQLVAKLVQRYLVRICAEHAGVSDGKLANYIPELASVDPNGFAMSTCGVESGGLVRLRDVNRYRLASWPPTWTSMRWDC